MDDFSQRMYAAAQARQKKIDNKFSELGLQKKPPLHESQPNMSSDSSEFEHVKRPDSSSDSQLSHLKENISPIRSKVTRVSSEMPGKESPQFAHKTLNIHKENFEMEIKLRSADDVRVEVEIEEHDDDGTVTRSHESVVQPLRKSVKTCLQKLGQLYSNEDGDLSSPIHRTEEKFDQSSGDCEDKSPVASKKNETEARKKRLAQLASNLNSWEDDICQKKEVKSPPRKSWKQPAPQPPKKEEPKKGPAPKPPSNKLNWDKKVIDSLESQGFSRVKSGSELPKTPEKTLNDSGVENNTSPVKKVAPAKPEPITKSPSKSILSKAAFFEKNSPTKASPKDPALLSVSERKALFEKNKGEALIPKAAFGMAAPVKETPKPEIARKPVIVDSTVKPTTTSANENSGIAGKLKALLHQATTISESQIKQQREQEKQKELEMLKNRFVKPKEETDSKVVESEESDEDNEDVDESRQMLKNQYNKNVTFKASRESLASLTSRKSLTSLKKSFEEGAKSLLGVGNSMHKLNESPSPKAKKLHKRRSSGDHPIVQEVLEDVKRIKVVPPKNGHLYPCLSDIEASSTANEDTDRAEQSDEQSSINDEEDSSIADSDMADTSFGREILAAVNRNHEVLKTTAKLHNSTTTSSDLSDVLNEMNDYLDEQDSESSDDEAGPTPPKHRAPGGGISSSSFHYSTTSTDTSPKYASPSKTRISPKKETENLPTHILDGDSTVPLVHTVSFYRKQQNLERTPIKKIVRTNAISEESPEKETSEDTSDELIDEKIQNLMDEVCKQQTVISQASQAINLCTSTIEFSGSSEEVEAERLLLLATQRRQAALHEAQRLRIERTLRPIGSSRGMMDVDRCSITLSEIALPLKRDYIRALTAAGGLGHHLLCLIRYAEFVHVTPLVATGNPPNPPQIIARLPGVLKLEDIYPDFTITVEVYSMQAHEEIIPHDVKYHIGGKDKKSKLTPKKVKHDSKLHRTPIQSPAGPSAVRTSSFQLMGYIVFSIREVNRTQWSLNKVPHVSPLEGQLLMHVECDISVNVEMHGFLNMFEDVAGFGAWHRRWCYLKGDTLSYWKYPDDERKKPPIGSINLQGCVTDNVSLVSRDICARPNTFLLEFVRPKQSGDVESLVMIVQNGQTTIRHLLSADTKEERIEWCKQLNKALSTMKSFSGK